MWPNTSYRLRLRVRTTDVQAIGGRGYAFVAVYQFDYFGNLLNFRDLVHLTGTNPWQKLDRPVTTHGRAFYVELRLGLHNARGKAFFDDLQFLPANAPAMEQAPARGNESRTALILAEPTFPANGAAPRPELLAQLVRRAGYHPQLVRAAELTDRRWIEGVLPRTSLLVLPNAPYFPLEAHRGLLTLLTEGVDLLAFGGYAFDVPLQGNVSRWTPVRIDRPLNVLLLNRNPGFDGEPAQPETGPKVWKGWIDGTCFITSGRSMGGNRCAAVRLPSSRAGSAVLNQVVEGVQPGQMLRLSGRVKTRRVTGEGYAFLAYYPRGGNRAIEPRDIAQVRGSRDWQHFQSTFIVPAGADRVDIRFGLYQAAGEAFFDDVRLEQVEFPRCINTHFGRPEDALEISPWQLGMFDADYRLERVRRLEAGTWSFDADSPMTGFSAVGVLRAEARWEPVVRALDRFGSLRGTAGAVMVHRAGPFAGSHWAFFGVDNVDLTQTAGFNENVLLPLLRRLRRGVFLCRLRSRLASYRPGEAVEVTCTVGNFGPQPLAGELELRLTAEQNGAESRAVGSSQLHLQPGETRSVHLRLPEQTLPEGLYRVTARLRDAAGGQCLDSLEAGFVVWDGRHLPQSMEFEYAENYFRLGGKPVFLCATTTWANWFASPSQSDPLFWWQELRKMRRFGILAVANLQTWWHEPYQLSRSQWRQLDAAVYLAARAGVVYRAGLFVGHNVAVDESTLRQQERFVAQFARRYQHADALIYYVNGDYQLRPTLPQQRSLAWQIAQTRKWNQRLVAAIRSVDQRHPILSEYYQMPLGGLDVRHTLDGLDVAEIGYFGEPKTDLRRFPAVLKLVDHRLYGKSLAIGEFGVKTHPAWQRQLGAKGYHMRRTPEEQKRLFLLLPQYCFALGGSTARNWCWRDDDDRVFPWGLTRPCDGVARDCLKAFRAASVLLQRLRPRWQKPSVLLIVADSRRIDQGERPRRFALAAADALVRLGIDFAVASDLNLSDAQLEGFRATFLPVADVTPETRAALERFEQRGGVLCAGLAGNKVEEPVTVEVGTADPLVLARYRDTLRKAGVERITIEPASLPVQAFPVTLENGTAVVLVNAGDSIARFTARIPRLPSLQMELAPWQPGLVAVNEKGRVFALEGSGRICWGKETIAESDGHFILFAIEETEDLATGNRLLLVPTGGQVITIHRQAPPGRTEAQLGRLCQRRWKTIQALPVDTVGGSGITIRLPNDVWGDLVRLLIGKRRESPTPSKAK